MSDPNYPPPPPTNVIASVAAAFAALSLVLGLIFHPAGAALGIVTIMLGCAGIAQAVRTDVGLGRSLFALGAGLFVVVWSALLLFSQQ